MPFLIPHHKQLDAVYQMVAVSFYNHMNAGMSYGCQKVTHCSLSAG